MGRSPCCSKVGLRRGPWSTKEDSLLSNYIQEHGEGNWRSLPNKAGLLRCGKSCRLRWMNYLRPGIKRGNISEDEEDLIVRLHKLLGNRWSLIAGRLPGRTDNEIKNHWNTHLLKKLKDAGVQPKPAKSGKKSGAGEKKKKQGKEKKEVINENRGEEQGNNNKKSEEDNNKSEKIKVYLPKPIRVSPGFSRSSSYDSLVSDGGEAAERMVAYTPVAVAWSPLFDLAEAEEDFIMGGYILPVGHHSDSISSDLNMLDQVYHEYVQLL